MKNLFLISVLAMSLAACGDRIKPDVSINDNIAGLNDGDDSAKSGGIGDGADDNGRALDGGKVVSYEEDAINDPNNVLSEKIIYFVYDANSVGDEFIELVKHHGRYLSFNTNASVRLEGHADERGTREYNIALGEGRARAVKEIMLYEGATSDQISVISYGEEKPVSFGRDDESMSLNRRVEISYQ